VSWQTKKGNPALAAWGDTLVPGMKAIAVSRDLIDSGLTHNTKVFIEELNDTFLVKDKMNRRWRKKIDIYMGTDVQKARNFGKKKLNIKWLPKENKPNNN
jgi:3D (Asp-Asp-Asp) domain-containing protein